MSNPLRFYHQNGKLELEMWVENNRYHRIDGPAFQKWDESGNLLREAWYLNGEVHRIDGPAYQDWNEDGNLIDETWAINDNPLTDKEITVIKRKLKLCQIQ